MSVRSLMRGWHALPAIALTVVATLGACSDGLSVGPGLDEQKIGIRDLKAYRLGIGDKVRLSVFREEDLSGTFEINAAGRIALPLVGEIEAAGVDATGLRERIVRRLADGYLNNPKVTVEVVGYRPIYVHGEVRKGGEFPFKSGMRLRDVVALAGGYTYRANEGYILLSRDGAPEATRVRMPNDALAMPGDNVRVPERYF